jgi:hypothetical protein
VPETRSGGLLGWMVGGGSGGSSAGGKGLSALQVGGGVGCARPAPARACLLACLPACLLACLAQTLAARPRRAVRGQTQTDPGGIHRTPIVSFTVSPLYPLYRANNHVQPACPLNASQASCVGRVQEELPSRQPALRLSNSPLSQPRAAPAAPHVHPSRADPRWHTCFLGAVAAVYNLPCRAVWPPALRWFRRW